MREPDLNPNCEVTIGDDEFACGAHASRVPFSASRRKSRRTYFSHAKPIRWNNEGLGGTPKPARGTRALPISISKFGLIMSQVGGLHG